MMIFTNNFLKEISNTKSVITLLITFLMVFSTVTLKAQETTFTVTVEEKTSEHPYFGEGNLEGFAIDGVQGQELQLERGKTYEFQMDDIGLIHPFYLSTDPVGAGAEPYEESVSGTPASENETVTFTPTSNAPDSVWYQCGNHLNMGWKIFIVEPTSIENDIGRVKGFVLRGNYPNPFNPQTTIQFDLPENASVGVRIFNAAGQMVMEKPARRFGPGQGHTIKIDANGLNSGIYFYNLDIENSRRSLMLQGRMTLIK